MLVTTKGMPPLCLTVQPRLSWAVIMHWASSAFLSPHAYTLIQASVQRVATFDHGVPGRHIPQLGEEQIDTRGLKSICQATSELITEYI